MCRAQVRDAEGDNAADVRERVCVFVRACMRARAFVCIHACVRECVHVCVCVLCSLPLSLSLPLFLSLSLSFSLFWDDKPEASYPSNCRPAGYVVSPLSRGL
jgi:hypothetical protein